MTEELFIRDAFRDKITGPYLRQSFLASLSYMGYSRPLINEIFEAIENLTVDKLTHKYDLEFHKLQDIGFFQDHVPKFAKKFLIPPVPKATNVLDLGCGTGSLMNTMSEFDRFEKLTGIDINRYPEWDNLNKPKLTFKVIKEDKFPDFIKKLNPDMVTITWVLHHMEYDEQERYLNYLKDVLSHGTKVVVLEDCYSMDLKPENDHGIYEDFMTLTRAQRQTVMSVYDWVANKILARRSAMPMPFAYRTFEEWKELFAKHGFKYHSGNYIGFAEHRDVNTPQSLLIFERA